MNTPEQRSKRAGSPRLPWLMVAILVPGAAHAQSAPVRTFSISPQLRLEDDSNVLRLPDASPTPAGFHRSDVRASPQVAINITRPIGRQSVFLSGLVGYDFYRYNKQLERERINLTGGGSFSAGSCTTNAQVTYSRRQSDLDDIVVSNFGRGRNLERELTPSVGISCGSAGGLSSSLSYSHDDIQNSDPFRSFGDYSADTYNAQIGLNRPVIGNVGIYTNYRRGVYDNRFLGNGQNETVKSYATGVRLDRQFGRIRGHVSAGVSRVESNTPGVRPFRGGTYDVSLSYITPRLTALVGLARNVQQSNLLGVSYSIVDDSNAALSYRLNPRIGLNAGANYTRRRLSQSPLAPVAVGNRNDHSRTYNVGASFDAARHVSFDLGAIWRKRSAELPIFDYKARILALTIRIH